MGETPTTDIRFKVIGAVVGLLTAIILFSAWTIASSFRMAKSAGERQVRSYAYALSEHGERALAEADRVLVEAIDAINAAGGLERLGDRELYEILRNKKYDAPQIGSLVVVNRGGELFAHSLSYPMKTAMVADRDYFNFHRDNPGGGLFISRPLLSRVNNKWRFTLSRPLLDRQGAFTGLVAVAFEMEYFQKFYHSLEVGKRGRIILARRDSTILVVEPFSEKALSTDFSRSELFREKLRQADAGTFMVDAGAIDGTARIASYTTLSRYPVVAIVSLATDELFASWLTSSVKHGLTTIVLCVLIACLTMLHLRQIRKLEETNQQLLENEEEIRSGEEQRIQVEAQLQQAQKMESIGHLAGGIAHDFNNLLTPIIGYTELLQRSETPEKDAALKLQGIHDAAMRAKELTQQLLGFARKQVMAMTVFDLNAIVSSFDAILRRVIRQTIEIRLELGAEPLYVMVDQSQLEQVLLNLAVNAQDAIPAHGTLTIRADSVILDDGNRQLAPELPLGRYAVLSCHDTGRGMSDETLAQIFEPFFTTKPAGHGTGLGLSMVYGIVKQHDGSISVQSSPDEGTVFTIYLPQLEDVCLLETNPSQGEQQINRGTESIFVVEDNEMVRDMIVQLLDGCGYRVTSAASPAVALELLETSTAPYDLLVSDVIMPGMNGPELYDRILDRFPDTKALFISGYTDDPAFTNITRSSAVSFLAKPFAVDALLTQARELLGNS